MEAVEQAGEFQQRKLEGSETNTRKLAQYISRWEVGGG